jgi:uncharacterized iron-regulated membrane protein
MTKFLNGRLSIAILKQWEKNYNGVFDRRVICVRNGTKMNLRRVWRKLLYLSHLWIGLILGLYFSLLGLTGSSLIFKNELNRVFERNLHQIAVPADKTRASLDTIVQTFKQTTFGAKIGSIILPEKPDETITIVYRSIQPNQPGGARHDWRQCFINPYSGAIVGDEIGGGEFFHTIRNLHARLLLEDVGINLNRYGVLFIIVLLISGIWLWFPSTKYFLLQLLQRTTIRFDGAVNRVVFDTHNAVGFYSSSFLLVLATTAVTALWYDQSNAVVSFLTHSPFFAKKELPSQERELTFSYDQVFQNTKNAVPGYSPVIITSNMTVLMQPPDNHFVFPRLVNVSMDEKTCAIAKIDRPQDKPLGMQIMNWTMPVHFGQWGYGIGYYPVKCLWVLIGFCPSILCTTGFLMFWEKQKAEKRATERRASARVFEKVRR